MFKPKIRTLYKYRSIDKYSLRMLTSGRVWCAKPESFNDPFDSQYSLSTIEQGIRPEDFLELFEKVYGWSKTRARARLTDIFLPNGNIRKTVRKRIVDRMEDLRRLADMGVFCLSEDPRNILMWSHYATEHKGMCVGFERHEENALGNDGICLPVTYASRYLTADTIRIFLRKGFSPVEDMMRTKSHHWKYEKEWRLFSIYGDAEAEAPGRISTIIFGCRTPVRARNRVLSAVDGQAIDVYRAELLTGKFRMRLEKL